MAVMVWKKITKKPCNFIKKLAIKTNTMLAIILVQCIVLVMALDKMMYKPLLSMKNLVKGKVIKAALMWHMPMKTV